MRKTYAKNLLLSFALMTAATAEAINVPCAKAPEDGKNYILVSRSNPQNYWNRTTWDGAIVLQPYGNFNSLNAFTAHKTDKDGVWNFSLDVVTAIPDSDEKLVETFYMGIPDGSDNLNFKLYDPAEWTVEPSDKEGYYLLKAGEGQGNVDTQNGYLHLNANNDYPVISEIVCGGQYYPDFYGGVQKDEDEQPVLDESGFVVPLNPVSRYWAFIEVGDVAAFSAKMPIYAQLQNIEDNYLSDDTYKAGFQSTIDAALPYYNKVDFSSDDLSAAKAIIDAKLGLYKEIESAKKVLGDAADATLKAAIDAAIATFNAESGVDATAAAQETLKKAERAYVNQGTDITALGTNMSFEDLSAQGGSQTTGVAGAPLGWSVFIRGNQVTTANEVSAAGVTAWHGVNNDAEGEPMDGELAFGLWTSGVPQYEVSQTITGLENGTYTVSAGLMVGANGNGSRRTTQRLFGNLNATYFATEADYNAELLDQNEVYGFAELEEPQTDRLLQEISVRAFVYDGTLTFGVRTDGNIAAANRETSNGAGGDGWFKVDNFRIMKEGFVKDDALAVYNHFAEVLSALNGEKMEAGIAEELKSVVAASKADGSSTEEQIVSALKAVKDFYPTAKASADLYAKLYEAYENGTAQLITYQYSSSADDFGDLLMAVEETYDEGSANAEQVAELIKKINDGIDELKATAISLGDITYVVKNPSFEDLSAQGGSVSDGSQPAPAGWTLYVNGEQAESVSGGWCAINHGDNINVELEDGSLIEHQYTDGEHLWGIWNANIPEVELSQTLKNLPAGTYKLQADVMVQYNWAGDNTTTQRIFANRCVQMWGSEGSYSEMNTTDDMLNAAKLTYAENYCAAGQEGLFSSDLLHPMEVTFSLNEGDVARIGFRTNGVNVNGETFAAGGINGQGWFKVDNFRLTYVSEEVDPALTAVEAVKTVATGGAEAIYRLDGSRVSSLQRGVNIVKTEDGKTKKVIF